MDILERESQISLLEAALAEVSSGTGRLVLVSGEAGIGKTALVETFTRDHQKRVRVLWGACDSLFTPRPLGPLHDVAAQIQGSLPALLTSNVNRVLIFSTVLVELQRRTTILVFEDLHWADEATLDLLRYIGRRIARTSTLLVLTYRDDELGLQHPLRSVLGDLASSSATRRILIPPLSERAVRTLVGERGIDSSALHRQTRGNPFYVAEVLANPGGGIPANIREAVLARVARLSASGYAVLEAAAIIGQRIEPWLLSAVTGAETPTVEESLVAGILLAQEDVLVFRHELARNTILEMISPPHRRVLHRLVLDALKSSPVTCNDLARLAHHAEAVSDHESVLEHAPAAAKQAAASSAHRQAAALYALALRFANELPPDQRALWLESYARELALIEERSAALEARRQAADLWRAAGNPLKQGANLADSVLILIGMGRNAEAEQASRSAIQLLEMLPHQQELALAYSARAALHHFNRNHAEAIAWGEKSIALLERIGNTAALTTPQLSVGSAWMFLDYERGCSYLEEALTSARLAGQEIAVTNILTHLGAHSCELFHFHRAEQYLREGVAYAAARDIDFLRFIMLAWLALTLLHLGRWSEAAAVASDVLGRPSVSAISRIWALIALGRLHARRGNPEARQVLAEAQEIATHAANVQHLGLVRVALAEAAWLAGDSQSTIENAQAAYDLALNKRHPWITGELAYWLWRCGVPVMLYEWMAKPFSLQISGDWRAAADEWERLGCPYEQARALADGDIPAQIAALEIFERLGARPAAEELRLKLQTAGVPHLPRKPRSSTLKNPFALTSRQVEILALLIDDLSNTEIASRLHISPKTADHHVSAVLARLEVHSREAAAMIARQHPFFSKK